MTMEAKLKNIIKSALSLLIIGMLLVSFEHWQAAMAVSGDYTKVDSPMADSQLSLSDWNNLPNDFLSKHGDTMGGNLDMNGQKIINTVTTNIVTNAATKSYVDSRTGMSGAVKNPAGGSLTSICDRSGAGTNWTTVGANMIETHIDTTNGGVPLFASLPSYEIGLSGPNSWDVQGNGSILNPSNTGFTVRLITAFTEAQAESWNWEVIWCGFGI